MSKEILKIHCSGCGRTVAVDDKDEIKVTCPKCKKIIPIDKRLHPSEEKHLKNLTK